MVDPVTCGVLTAGAGVVLRLADAGAEWLRMRGRVRLVRAVAQLPPGSEIRDARRAGGEWTVRVSDARVSEVRL